MVLHVFTGGPTLEVTRGAREKAELVDCGRHFIFHEPGERLSRVATFNGGQLFAPRFNGVSHLEEGHLALVGRGLFPLGEGRPCCGIGLGHVLLRGIRDGGVHLSG